MLDVKQIYIDSRFKTADSPSDSDFYIELPRAMNIPDKCVCYIDDIVIPVSWTMVDDRNARLFLAYKVGPLIDDGSWQLQWHYLFLCTADVDEF